MTSTTARPGRPLPAAVYWRRRMFVLGVLVALVLIAVNVVRGDPEPDAGAQASTASAETADGADDSPAAGAGDEGRGGKGRKGARRDRGEVPDLADLAPGPTVVMPTAPPLAEPEGVCADEDIAVTPTVRDAVAGRSATIVLALRTITSPACTWDVTAESLAVRISVGDDAVWASWECPAQLPVRSVVVRQAVATSYELTWNTRRSDTDCPASTEYAEPGDYRVTAAAYGGEPDDLVFDLAAPVAPVVEEPAAQGRQGKKRQRSEAEQRAPASVDEAR
jgi:hypothetical protein